jgi:endonuclease I
MRTSLFLLIVSLFLSGFSFNNLIGQIPSGYYNGTENLNGISLKSKLHEIIKGHKEYPYTSNFTDVWDILKETDKDTLRSDNIILFYTDWSVNAAQEYNDGAGWTREHIWAKSHGNFGTETGPGTDVHALRPCDVSLNSKRSNLDFAEGGEIYTDPDGITGCKYTSNSWEPNDAFKGDVARMIFYMAVRYEGGTTEPNLEVVDYVNSSPNYEPLHGKLSDLLKWNLADPPDNGERRRNDIIYYKYQHNRNPFIDNPEFADKIFKSLVSIDKPNFDIKFEIFPNPAKERLYLKIHNFNDSMRNLNLTITDTSGNQAFSLKIHSDQIKIPCNRLSTGLYIVKIEYLGTIIFQKKIIIN